MNIKLIILSELKIGSSLFKKRKEFCSELEMLTKKNIEVIHDIKTIKFDDSTYYLLFCPTFYNYEEIVENSHKMILMNAIYPSLGNIMRDFNFGGIVCYRHFIQSFPLLFGLKNVISNIDNLVNHPPLIKSEKYESFFRPNLSMLDVIYEYLLFYDASR